MTTPSIKAQAAISALKEALEAFDANPRDQCAAFSVAANPEAIRTLIALVEASEKEKDRLTLQRDHWQEQYIEAATPWLSPRGFGRRLRRRH